MSENLHTYDIDPVRAKFRSSELEADYRASTYGEDLRLYSVGVAIFCIPVVLFAWSDYQLFGTSPQFLKLIGARALGTLVFLGSIAVVYGVKNAAQRDLLAAFMLAMASTVIFYVNWTRPPEYVLFVTFDIVAALAFFVMFRVGFLIQLALATFFIVSDLALIFLTKDTGSPIGAFSIGLTFGLVILLGAVASWQRQTQSRERFAAKIQVKTLKGFVPICANCLKVRDDDGFWTQVAAYIDEQTDAQVTHGICPECSKELYPEVHKKAN